MNQPAPSRRDITRYRQPAHGLWLALVLLSGLVLGAGVGQSVAAGSDSSGLLSGDQSLEMGAPSDLSNWNSRLRPPASDGDPDWKPPSFAAVRNALFSANSAGTQGLPPSYSENTFPRFTPSEAYPPRAPPFG